MAPRLFVGDLAVFEQLDERGAADAQQVRSLLCSEALMHRRNRDRLALRHRCHNVAEHSEPPMAARGVHRWDR